MVFAFFLVWRHTVIAVLQLEHVMKVNVLVSLLLKGAMLGSINGINNINIKEPATQRRRRTVRYFFIFLEFAIPFSSIPFDTASQMLCTVGSHDHGGSSTTSKTHFSWGGPWSPPKPL